MIRKVSNYLNKNQYKRSKYKQIEQKGKGRTNVIL